jgi:hypothetical protein
VKESPRVVVRPQVQPVVRQRPQRPQPTPVYNSTYVNQTPQQSIVRNTGAIQIDGNVRQGTPVQYQPQYIGNIRQGTPPRFQTRRKERISVGQYSANKVQISRTTE